MKRLLVLPLFLALGGCGAVEALNATKNMPTKMDAMKGGMDTTNAKVHKQSLLVAMTEMLQEKNIRYLGPALRMYAPGKAFAEEATPEELVELTYAWLKEVNEYGVSEAQTQEEKDKLDHEKFAKILGLQVLAGFAPQATVNAIIDDQILRGWRYENAAYAFLYFRAQFIQTVLFESTLGESPLKNVGMIKYAVDYARQLDMITTQPFAGRIGVKATGFFNKDFQLVDKLDVKTSVRLWEQLAYAVQNEIDPQSVGTGDQLSGAEKAARAGNSAQLDALRSTIRERLKAWGSSVAL